MVGLLGVMVTILALMAGVFGFFGYTAIKEAAIRQAERKAEEIARETALDALRKSNLGREAAAYSESQNEIYESKVSRSTDFKTSQAGAKVPKPSTKRKATSDLNLRQEDEQ